MRPQVEIEREALVANFALVRLFAGVHQAVALQFRVIEELFAASSD